MLVGVSAPDLNYIRYMPDRKTELTETRKTYRYEFTMDMETDANGRLEFNMGNVRSTDDIFISSVSIKLLEFQNTQDKAEAKTVLADGNYIYNGKFQEGTGRLGFWETVNDGAAVLSVTDFADGRRLSIDGGNIRAANPLVLRQSGGGRIRFQCRHRRPCRQYGSGKSRGRKFSCCSGRRPENLQPEIFTCIPRRQERVPDILRTGELSCG